MSRRAIAGWEEDSVSLPGPVSVHVWICWGKVGTMLKAQKHARCTRTPKAILSNYDLLLQAYGHMYPCEYMKVQIYF